MGTRFFEVILLRLSKKEIVDKVRELAKPIVEGLGFELFDVQFKSQGGRWILTVYIDNPADYVSTRDCELVSYQLERVLDREGVVASSYILEVSSPGLDRPLRDLKDFARFVGRLAKVKAQQTFVGKIKSVDEETSQITLETEKGEVKLSYSEIKSANLEVEF